jgi:hypothetical protein
MAKSERNMGIFGSMSEVKLNELRRMMVGLDTEDLRRLALLVNDPEAFSEEISELLPHSIKVMLDKDNISYSELTSVLESALKESINKDPRKISDLLFPIMMPAIRKAVAEAIKKMVDSLNTTLEHGFSPKRIGWRFKAMFSGRSYAEIVLSNAYIFQVKQVFLIHKKTGLLLNETSDIQNSVTKDSDLMSSMLSAIKDFVQDSFDVEKSNELETIKVGQFNIWIEQGPEVIIAAIVEGDAHSGFRTQLKETVENVHLKHLYELDNFSGDVDIFKKSDPYLQDCLISEQKEKKKKKPVIVILLFIAILVLASYWTYIVIEQKIRLNNLEDELRTEYGIVITNDYNDNGKTVFEGLRDPLAKDPFEISRNHNVDTSEVAFNFTHYISLESNLILKRAYAMLKPPPTAKLSFNDGVLYATGLAGEDWIKNALITYPFITGVKDFNLEKLNTPIIKQISLLIEQYYFVFNYGTVDLNEEQQIKFENLIEEVNNVLNFDFAQDSVPVINVIAHTSYKGNALANKKVAFDRALQFINLMILSGIPLEVLVPKTDYIEDIDNAFPVRSVSFKVIYSKPEDL